MLEDKDFIARFDQPSRHFILIKEKRLLVLSVAGGDCKNNVTVKHIKNLLAATSKEFIAGTVTVDQMVRIVDNGKELCLT